MSCPTSQRARREPSFSPRDFLRAYAEKLGAKPVGSKGPFKGDDESSPWSLIFDCETGIDAAQSLRLGAYQVREGGRLDREGLFYDPAHLPDVP